MHPSIKIHNQSRDKMYELGGSIISHVTDLIDIQNLSNSIGRYLAKKSSDS